MDSGLVIVHVISTCWGPQGPARDRFFAFDKKTGVSVWSSTPGGPPRDSSFSFPVVGMIPLSEDLARLESRHLFLRRFPDHEISHTWRSVADRIASV